VAGEQVAEPLGVDAAAGQRGVGAAPAASVGRFQAQVWQRPERRLAAEQGVAELEQRGGAAGQAGMQLGAEALQSCQRCQMVGVGGPLGWGHT
jgi:hypothetical protein